MSSPVPRIGPSEPNFSRRGSGSFCDDISTFFCKSLPGFFSIATSSHVLAAHSRITTAAEICGKAATPVRSSIQYLENNGCLPKRSVAKLLAPYSHPIAEWAGKRAAESAGTVAEKITRDIFTAVIEEVESDSKAFLKGLDKDLAILFPLRFIAAKQKESLKRFLIESAAKNVKMIVTELSRESSTKIVKITSTGVVSKFLLDNIDSLAMVTLISSGFACTYTIFGQENPCSDLRGLKLRECVLENGGVFGNIPLITSLGVGAVSLGTLAFGVSRGAEYNRKLYAIAQKIYEKIENVLDAEGKAAIKHYITSFEEDSFPSGRHEAAENILLGVLLLQFNDYAHEVYTKVRPHLKKYAGIVVKSFNKSAQEHAPMAHAGACMASAAGSAALALVSPAADPSPSSIDYTSCLSHSFDLVGKAAMQLLTREVMLRFNEVTTLENLTAFERFLDDSTLPDAMIKGAISSLLSIIEDSEPFISIKSAVKNLDTLFLQLSLACKVFQILGDLTKNATLQNIAMKLERIRFLKKDLDLITKHFFLIDVNVTLQILLKTGKELKEISDECNEDLKPFIDSSSKLIQAGFAEFSKNFTPSLIVSGASDSLAKSEKALRDLCNSLINDYPKHAAAITECFSSTSQAALATGRDIASRFNEAIAIAGICVFNLAKGATSSVSSAVDGVGTLLDAFRVSSFASSEDPSPTSIEASKLPVSRVIDGMEGIFTKLGLSIEKFDESVPSREPKAERVVRMFQHLHNSFPGDALLESLQKAFVPKIALAFRSLIANVVTIRSERSIQDTVATRNVSSSGETEETLSDSVEYVRKNIDVIVELLSEIA